MDQATNLQELKKMVVEFRDERDWRKYDTPKNLAISISIEAAELLEHFQWKTDAEVDEMSRNPQKRREVSDELADVMIYCLGFADMLKIDVAEALRKKLEKTSEKYPALKSSTL
jgi:NTP pyrophosphatase (non-canonical NTP hydrolase)